MNAIQEIDITASTLPFEVLRVTNCVDNVGQAHISQHQDNKCDEGGEKNGHFGPIDAFIFLVVKCAVHEVMTDV